MHLGRGGRERRWRAGLVAIAVGSCAAVAGCAAQTDPATVSGPTSARLNAHGHTDTSAAHYEFQYAPDPAVLGTADGFVTPTRGPFPAGIPNVAFSEQVAALRPATTYSFRVCGGDARINPDLCDATRTFTTPAGTPAVDFATSTVFDRQNVGLGQVVAADLNRDGNLDVAALGGVSPAPRGPVLVFAGDGRGGFGAPSSTGPAAGLTGASALATGDVDADGKPDLAIGSTTATGQAVVLVLEGDGSGSFTPLAPTGLPGAAGRLVAADLDRDGKLDLAAVAGSHLVTLRGDGHGGFAAPVEVAPGGLPEEVAVRDMNHDAIGDVVVGTSSPTAVSVLLGDGHGAFGAPRQTGIPSLVHVGPGELAVADFDRDGNRDVAVRKWMLRGDGTGTLRAPLAIENGLDSAAVTADFNVDGRPDLAGGYGPGRFGQVGPRIRVLLGNGDGTFQTPNDFTCGTTGPCGGGDVQTMAVGDFAHGGRPSLVAGIFRSPGGGTTESLLAMARNATGT
jgi:hypothetical protein